MFRGFSSEETKAAFTKAQEMLVGIDDATERYVTYYGLWLPTASRGDLLSGREIAETFWRDAESSSHLTETAIALSVLGFTCFVQGDFENALTHLQNAVRIHDPQRDRDAMFRFNLDAGAWATLYLAITHWLLGQVEHARKVIDDARRRAIEFAHAAVLALHYDFEAMLETLRGDAEAAQRSAQRCIDISREHGLAVFLSEGIGYLGWASVKLGDREAGMAQLYDCIATHVEQGNRAFIPFFQGLVAEVEGRGDGLQEPLSRINEAITLTTEMGTHWCEALLLHILGKILLNCDPTDAAAAEAAFLAAIDVAQRLKAKSFELRAALSLANLYQSRNRAAEAHAVLTSALEDFSPTPEFPEIGQAQTLLAALAELTKSKRPALHSSGG